MEHVPQSLLERYAHDPMAVASRDAIELHLAKCDSCRNQVRAIRELADALRNPTSWAEASDDDVEARPPTREDAYDSMANQQDLLLLAAFARQVKKENAEAEELASEFMSGSPSGFVWNDVSGQQRFRTGGVVRLLANEANKTCERHPRSALSYARAACAIAEALPENVYPFNAIHDLRGVTWKECANAQRYLGNLPAAHDALDRAERAFSKAPAPLLGISIVRYIRALIYSEQGKLDAALEEIRKCTHGYEDLGLTAKYVAAQNVHGIVCYKAKRFTEARNIFAGVLAYGESANEKTWIARAYLNLGLCDLETSHYSTALGETQTARRMFFELDLPTEVLRADAALGRIFVALGRRSEGIKRLDETSKAFSDLGAVQDMALTTLYALEARLPDGNVEELKAVAQQLVKSFISAGRLTGALAAAAYVKELATRNPTRLTPGTLAYIREFISRSERHPQLVFRPPPSES